MNTFLTLVCVVFLGNLGLSQLETRLNSEHPKINFNGIQINGKTHFLNFVDENQSQDEETPTVPTA
ncbi:hypothetical protein PL11201_170038 [Planktothrix sp. PCC 11201]|uniref:hypothetical protein n=1 Tax=Planktothrix sp. PCC 11201 TaxID=1729650 RepID=UPI000915215E|nr:hypothetical protein [Planktothrix sp. PCC 11201]SKB11655.1 hypothetical protein PL11201_170038 [Planktothrix sp. PCC 11201]